MAKCPNCNENISHKLSADGGICPRCAHIILAFSDDFDFEPSDTQEKQHIVSGAEQTEPEMIPFADTEEYEATEMIRPLPKRGKGSVADADYQEDFPDADFIEEQDCITVEKESVPPQKKNLFPMLSVIGLLLLSAIGMVLFFNPQDNANSSTGEILRHDVSYSNGYSAEQIALQKAKEEEERKAKEEKRRAQRAKAFAKEEAENNIDPKIEKALDARMGSLQGCMDMATFKDRKFDSTIQYTLTIEPDGSVSSSSFSVKGDTTQNFESCIQKALAKWRFPATESRTNITRTF